MQNRLGEIGERRGRTRDRMQIDRTKLPATETQLFVLTKCVSDVEFKHPVRTGCLVSGIAAQVLANLGRFIFILSSSTDLSPCLIYDTGGIVHAVTLFFELQQHHDKGRTIPKLISFN